MKYVRAIILFLCLSIVVVSISVFGEGTANQKDHGDITADVSQSMPSFSTRSLEPVLLRYRFKPEEQCTGRVEVRIENEIMMETQKIRTVIDMNMDALMVTKKVDSNGVASIDLTFTRITMNCTEPAPVSFDSNKNDDINNPQFKSLSVLVGNQIPVEVTERGEVKNIDMLVFNKVIDIGVDSALKDKIRESIEHLTKSSFIQLSKDPVKADDVYDAGAIVQPLPKIGEIHTSVQYKILSVSGDRKQVLLKPACKTRIKLNSPETAKAIMDSDAFDGWILFDTEKGNILKSRVESMSAISISEGPVTLKTKTCLKLKYVTDYR